MAVVYCGRLFLQPESASSSTLRVDQTRIIRQNPVLSLRSINRVTEDQVVITSHDMHRQTIVHKALLICYQDWITENLQDKRLKRRMVLRQELRNTVVGCYLHQTIRNGDKRPDELALVCVLVNLADQSVCIKGIS